MQFHFSNSYLVTPLFVREAGAFCYAFQVSNSSRIAAVDAFNARGEGGFRRKLRSFFGKVNL